MDDEWRPYLIDLLGPEEFQQWCKAGGSKTEEASPAQESVEHIADIEH